MAIIPHLEEPLKVCAIAPHLCYNGDIAKTMESIKHTIENLVSKSSDSFDQSINQVREALEESQGPSTLIMDLDGVFNDDIVPADYMFWRLYPERLGALNQITQDFPDASVKILTSRMEQFQWGQDWITDLQTALDTPDTVDVIQLNSKDGFNALLHGKTSKHTILTGAGKNWKERVMMHVLRPVYGASFPGGARIRPGMLTETIDRIVANTSDNIVVLDGEHDMYGAFHYAAERYNHRSFDYISIRAEERRFRQAALKSALITVGTVALLKFGYEVCYQSQQTTRSRSE